MRRAKYIALLFASSDARILHRYFVPLPGDTCSCISANLERERKGDEDRERNREGEVRVIVHMCVREKGRTRERKERGRGERVTSYRYELRVEQFLEITEPRGIGCHFL